MTQGSERELDGQLAAALVGGLEPRVVEIVDYKDEWPARFEQEKAPLEKALGGIAYRIEHIGSTSVPGLAAKDVVDICVTVEDADDDSVFLPAVESLGFSSPDDRRLYERVKRELAAAGEWRDVNYCADAKSAVIQEILERARSSDDAGSEN